MIKAAMRFDKMRMGSFCRWLPPLALAAGIVAAGFGLLARRGSGQQAMPPEYRELLLAVQRIASHNALGKQPQAFTITAGSMAAQLAEQRKLCQPDQCEFFSLLDPFRSYGRDWDELIRQSYGVGDLEAWSASSGTVILAQVSFRAYGPRRGWLACTVAHELAHIRRNHFFSTAITTTTPADMPRRSDASNSAMPADAPRKNRRIAIPR
jgi:hypothetical protein